MTNLDSQIEDLIIRLNKAEAENKALKLELTGYQKRVCSMCDGHGMVGNCLDSMDCPDCTGAINAIKADAFEEGFRYSCAVYNGASSEAVISVAVDSYKDELDG